MNTEDIKRLRFYEQQFLRAKDFQDEQAYHIEMRRRHLIGHHTWGLVVGLEIDRNKDSNVWAVKPGLAVDGYGREIIVSSEEPLNPAKIREEAQYQFGPALSIGQQGWVEIWITQYLEKTDLPAKGYETCEAANESTRIRENYRLLYRHIKLSEDPQPFENLPDDPEQSPWFVFLGTVQWECVASETNAAQKEIQLQPFKIKVKQKDGTEVDKEIPYDPSGRRYVGNITAEIIAPAAELKIRDRATKVLGKDDVGVAVKLEGSLRIDRLLSTHELETDGTIRVGNGQIVTRAKNAALYLNAGPDTDPDSGAKLPQAGIWFRTTKKLGDESSFEDLMRITSTGNVGIGTTKDLVRQLHVKGNGVHSSGANAGFSFEDRTGVLEYVESPTAGERWEWYSSNGFAKLWSGTDKITVTYDNKVGIGTDNPQAPLHLYSTNNPTVLRLQSSGKFGAGRLEFWSDPQGDASEWRPGFIQSTDQAAGTWTGGLAFFVNGTGVANKTAEMEVMRITNAKVGIGTTNPTHTLHVVAPDAVGLFESSGTQAYLRLSTREGLDNRVEITNRPGGRLSLWTSGGGDVLNITKDGRVGIGATDPTHRLHVVAPDAVGLFESTGTQAYLRLSTREGLDNRVEITNRPGGRLSLWTSGGGDALNITKDGKVGIGTTNPQAPLHLYSPDNPAVFRIQSSAQFGAGQLEFWSDPQGNANEWRPGFIRSTDQGGFTGGLGFFVNGTGSANKISSVEVMRITNRKVGIGTPNPQNTLHIQGNISGSADQITNHVAAIENTSTDSNADVLALKVGISTPNVANNFITFFGGNTAVGRIEGNGSGIVLTSGGADYAESLPRIQAAEVIETGDIMGIFAGKVTKVTKNAQQVMVSTRNPIVLGNMPNSAERHLHEAVAFVGQVLVKVRGVVQAGDYIVPSGLNDGTGVAVSPSRLISADCTQIVGQAWEASQEEGVKRINTLVGISSIYPNREVFAILRSQQAEIQTLRSELDSLKASLKPMMPTC